MNVISDLASLAHQSHQTHSEKTTRPSPKAAVQKESTLLQCGVQAVRDLFVPGHQGDRARVHSQYQLCKKLGIHQALDGQAYSRDLLSQTGRAATQLGGKVSQTVHRASQGTQEALTVAKDYWRDEARTATGAYRVLVGGAQGAQMTAQSLFSSAKSITKLAANSAGFTYRSLKGEVDFKKLLLDGGEKALNLADRGSRYLVSGRLPDDAKKFAKSAADFTTDYARKVKSDPGLEVPKLLTVVGTTLALTGGLSRGAGMASRAATGEMAAGEAAGGEMAASQAPRAAAAAEECAASQAPRASAAAEEAVSQAPQTSAAAEEGVASQASQAAAEGEGTIYPRNWPTKPGTVVPRNYGVGRSAAPAPSLPTQPPAPVPAPAPVAAPPAPVLAPPPAVAPLPTAPAPVQLPPSTLPLPVKTPVCLPSSNYAPTFPRGYLQPTEVLESCLNIVG